MQPMPSLNDDPSSSRALSARAVHREQVWAALIRAVDLLLLEAQGHLEDDLRRADRIDDVEGAQRLRARARVLQELHREITSSPP